MEPKVKEDQKYNVEVRNHKYAQFTAKRRVCEGETFLADYNWYHLFLACIKSEPRHSKYIFLI